MNVLPYEYTYAATLYLMVWVVVHPLTGLWPRQLPVLQRKLATCRLKSHISSGFSVRLATDSKLIVISNFAGVTAASNVVMYFTRHS